MYLKKNNILFIMQLPPPIHGASVMNGYIKKSHNINNQFNCTFINLSTSKKINQIGRFSFMKIILFINIVIKTLYQLSIKKFDLVFVTISPSGIGFIKDSLIVVLLKIFRKKIIFNLHGKGIKKFYKDSSYLAKKYCHFIFNKSFTIHLSKNLIKDTNDFKNISENFIIPNAVEKLDLKDIEVNKNKEYFQILFLSNLIESKGVTTILEAAKILVDEGNTNFRVKFAGNFESDEYQKFFNDYVQKNSLKQYIKYLGPKYNNEKNQIFMESDIFVFPTYYANETFGLVNIEAMQFGLPIVTCDEGAISDIVNNNINGFIIKKKSPHELKNKIKLLMTDGSLRKKIEIKNKQDFNNKYTLDIYEKNLISCFNKVINS